MKILIFRGFHTPAYSATFDDLARVGVGGTELQLLLHANYLVEQGHDVGVLGVSNREVIQQGVRFEASSTEAEALECLAAKYSNVDFVLAVTGLKLDLLRRALPFSTIVQVCQNGPNLEFDRYLDGYAMVGPGQMARYAVLKAKQRKKFVYLPNCTPFASQEVPAVTKSNQVIWVGGFEKQGLRRWGKAMSYLLREDPSLRWLLCGPSYSVVGKLPAALAGIDLPAGRVTLVNLPLAQLRLEIARSHVLIGSLGGEDGPVAYLDGHALAVPVLCGDDIVGKFANPEGTGLRCTTVQDCYSSLRFFLANPEVAKRVGETGRRWVQGSHSLAQQHAALDLMVASVALVRENQLPPKVSIQADLKHSLRFRMERLAVRLANFRRG